MNDRDARETDSTVLTPMEIDTITKHGTVHPVPEGGSVETSIKMAQYRDEQATSEDHDEYSQIRFRRVAYEWRRKAREKVNNDD